MNGTDSPPVVTIGKIASALIFPHYCPNCGREWSEAIGWICPKCWDKLPEGGQGRWSSRTDFTSPVFVAFHYGEIVKTLIHQLKFGGRSDVAPILGKRAARQYLEWYDIDEVEAVVPAPLHPIRKRERGFDQTHLIARFVAETVDRPLRDDLIRRIRHCQPQSRLSDAERMTNVRGAFAPIENARNVPSSVLLVDDVIHTGETIFACALALFEAGVEDVRIMITCG